MGRTQTLGQRAGALAQYESGPFDREIIDNEHGEDSSGLDFMMQEHTKFVLTLAPGA